MPKMTPREGAPALWHWMAERRVTLEELARLVEVTPQHLSDIRRGVRRPSDALKLAIERATIELERAQGVGRPKGVRVVSWFAPAPKGEPS
jgi:transcriptional regulator with XRE-family HTH domain